jgi:hypothetical protein
MEEHGRGILSDTADAPVGEIVLYIVYTVRAHVRETAGPWASQQGSGVG